MTHVVTDACQGCKYTDCVAVCPVDCFYEYGDMLVIHPDECIDCSLCISECPVEAIYPEDEVPEEQWEKWGDRVYSSEFIDGLEENVVELQEPLSTDGACSL